MRDLAAALARWPLLLLGVASLGYAAQDHVTGDVQALLLGVGAVCVGAGIVLVVWGHGPGDASDTRTPATRISDDTPDDTRDA